MLVKVSNMGADVTQNSSPCLTERNVEIFKCKSDKNLEIEVHVQCK